MNRFTRWLLALAMLAGITLATAPSAAASNRSEMIVNSSPVALRIITYNAPDYLLPPGQWANNRGTSSSAGDVQGFYQGPGWCTAVYRWDWNTGNNWVYYTTRYGAGDKYLPEDYTHYYNLVARYGC